MDLVVRTEVDAFYVTKSGLKKFVMLKSLN